MKKLNDLLEKNKALAVAVPIGLVIIFGLFYFSSQAKGNEKSFNNTKKTNIDTSLPEASENPLPESTLDVMNEYDTYEQNKAEDQKKNSNLNIEEDYNRTYQQPDDKVTEKLNTIINRFDKNTSSPKVSSRENNNSYSSPKVKTPVIVEDNVENENSTSEKKSSSSGFFKSSKKTQQTKEDNLTVFACVHTNQTIMNNQRVKLRTTKEFIYNGERYPINTIVYGIATVQPNRLIIKINRINQTDIKLEVYDSEDSLPGLYVLTPNLNAALKTEMQNEGLQEQDLNKIPFSKSLKSVFERKIREEKISLINNYKVIIKIDSNEK